MRGLALSMLLACSGKEAVVDAGVDAAPEVGPTCVYKDTRVSADRACKDNAECVVATFLKDCCTEQFAGIHKDRAAQFQADQKAMQTGCAACGCQAMPVDDLGVKGSLGAFKASCDMGVCTSHAN